MSLSGSRAASRLKTPLRGAKRPLRGLAVLRTGPSGPRIASRCLGLASLARKWPLRGLNPDFPIFGAKIASKKTDLKRKKLKFSKNLFTPLKVIHRRAQPQSLSSELQKLIELCPKNTSKIIIIIIKNRKETARKSKKPIFHKIFFSPLK